MKNTTEKTKYILPVHLSLEPIRRIIVANFKNDHEIEMIEPQAYDDPEYGKGLRVLIYRKDKKVDVYWQPGVTFDAQSFNIGDGLGHYNETEMSPSQFEITSDGVQIDIAFNDIQGRRIELVIRENTRQIKRFPFLAPVGNDVKKPDRLFLIYMQDFDFVVKQNTFFKARIGGRELHLASFPISRNHKKVYFTRYSAHPVIGVINPEKMHITEFESSGPGYVKQEGMNIQINTDQKVESIRTGKGASEVIMRFCPGLVNLHDLQPAEKQTGTWSYHSGGGLITGGTYFLHRNEDLVDFELDVTQNWKPKNLPLSFKIFTAIIKSFRTWPTTYRWKSSHSLSRKMMLSGSWERK